MSITFTPSKLHILPLMEVCMKKRKQGFEILFCQREIQGRLSLLIYELSWTMSLSQPQIIICEVEPTVLYANLPSGFWYLLRPCLEELASNLNTFISSWDLRKINLIHKKCNQAFVSFLLSWLIYALEYISKRMGKYLYCVFKLNLMYISIQRWMLFSYFIFILFLLRLHIVPGCFVVKAWIYGASRNFRKEWQSSARPWEVYT